MKKVSKHRMVMKKQVQQVFFERDILSFAENPFVVGLWCTFQTKVSGIGVLYTQPLSNVSKQWTPLIETTGFVLKYLSNSQETGTCASM